MLTTSPTGKIKGKALRASRTRSNAGEEPVPWYHRNPFAYHVTSHSKTDDIEVGTKDVKPVQQNNTLTNDDTAISSTYRPESAEDGTTQRIPADGEEKVGDTQDTVNPEHEEDEHGKRPGETSWQAFHRRMFVENQIPVGQQIRTVLFPHWYTMNWLLIFSPIGIGLHFVKGLNPLIPFLINFIAIVPLAGMLSNATEELALRVGEVLGGLLNASFG